MVAMLVANLVGEFVENRANREGLILHEVRDELHDEAQAGIGPAIRSAAQLRRC